MITVLKIKQPAWNPFEEHLINGIQAGYLLLNYIKQIINSKYTVFLKVQQNRTDACV